MYIQKALCLGLVLLQLAQCSPIGKNSTETVVFESTDEINVNGVKLSGLNCTLKGPLGKLCSYITEVTCEQEQNELRSCRVSSKSSIYYGKQVKVQSVVCADKRRPTSGNCCLNFRPPIAQGLSDALKFKVVGQDENGVPKIELQSEPDKPHGKEAKEDAKNKNIRDPFDDDDWFRDRRSKMNDQSNFFLVCFGIVFSLMFLLMIIALCRGICHQIGCHPCAFCCDPFRSTPITSEEVRRASFPRSNNYAVTTAAVQTTAATTTIYGQPNVIANNYPTYRGASNEYNDPPPKYTDVLPSYESLGHINKAYTGTLPTPAVPANDTKASAPEL